MRVYLFCLCYLLAGVVGIHASVLRIDVSNAPGEAVIEIRSIYGKNKTLVASPVLKNGALEHDLDGVEPGMLKIAFGASGPQLDIIHDGKDIHMSFDALQLQKTLSFEKSESNQNYYAFIRERNRLVRKWLAAYENCNG